MQSLYKPLGFFFVGVAALGVVLPVLPTTPFLLLSAWFFARSSERWHQWLLQNPLFGPIITNWEQNRCISPRTKAVAIGSMTLVGGASILFTMELLWIRLLTAALMTCGAAVVLSIPSCTNVPPGPDAAD